MLILLKNDTRQGVLHNNKNNIIPQNASVYQSTTLPHRSTIISLDGCLILATEVIQRDPMATPSKLQNDSYNHINYNITILYARGRVLVHSKVATIKVGC